MNPLHLYHHFKAHRGVHIFLGKNQLQRKRPSKSKMKMDVETDKYRLLELRVYNSHVTLYM